MPKTKAQLEVEVKEEAEGMDQKPNDDGFKGAESPIIYEPEQTQPAQQMATLDPMNQLISQAITTGDVNSLKEIIALQDHVLARKAEESFNKAMHIFQTGVSVIAVNATADTGRFSWKYAKLDHLHQKIRPALADSQLSFNFERIAYDSMAFARCTVRHVDGHSRYADFPIIVDKDAKVNQAQAYASAMNYAKRQAFTAALGLTVADVDDDGAASGVPQGVITEDQVSTIETLLKDTGSDLAGFLKFCKADSLQQLPANKFNKAVAALQAKQ